MTYRWGIAVVSVGVLVGCGGDGGAGTGGGGSSSSQGGSGAAGGSGGAGGVGGAGGAGSGGSTVPEAWVEACEQRHAFFCKSYFSCLPYYAPYYLGKDEAACIASNTAACVARYREDGTSPDEMAACTAAFSALTGCEELIQVLVDGSTSPLWPAPCSFTGEAMIGESCELDGQCASGWCTGLTGESKLCGTCAARLGEGEACPNGGCEHGLVCAGGTCTVLGALDDTCGNTTPCNANLACIDGTCGERLADGQPCAPMAPACNYDSVCNTLTSVCEPALPLAPEGQACGVDANGSVGLCEDTWCQIELGMDDGTCIAKLELGETCSAVNDVVGSNTLCAWPAVCFDGTCQLPGDVRECD